MSPDAFNSENQVKEIRILHIGDLLIDDHESAKPIVKAVRDYRNRFGAEESVDYLVVCGNLTLQGNADQFKAAHEVLHEIKDTLFSGTFSPRDEFPYHRIFVVPGARDLPPGPDGSRDSAAFGDFYRDFYAGAHQGSFEEFTLNGVMVRSLVDLTMIGFCYYLDVADPDTALDRVLKALSAAKSCVADWQYIVETPTVLVSSYAPLLSRDGSPRDRRNKQYQELRRELPVTVHLVGGPVTLIGREPYHNDHITVGTGPVSHTERWSGRMNLLYIDRYNWGIGPERKDLRREKLGVTAHSWPETIIGGGRHPVPLMGGHHVPTSKEGDGFIYEQAFSDLLSKLENDNIAIGVTSLPGNGKTQIFQHCQSQKLRFACRPLLNYNQWEEVLDSLLEEVEKNPQQRPIIVVHDKARRSWPGRFRLAGREQADLMDQGMENLAASGKYRIIYLRPYSTHFLPQSSRQRNVPSHLIEYELPPLRGGMMQAVLDRYSSRLPIKKVHLVKLTGGYRGFTLLLLTKVKSIVENSWPGAKPIEADTSWTLIEEALRDCDALERVSNRFFEALSEEAGGEPIITYILKRLTSRLEAEPVSDRLLEPLEFTVEEIVGGAAGATSNALSRDLERAAEKFVKAHLLQSLDGRRYRLLEMIPFLVRSFRAQPQDCCWGKVFISYSHRDIDRIRPATDLLRAEGFETFWDDSIRAGSSWTNELDRQLTDSACILVMLTRHAWDDNSFVRNEAEHSPDKVIPVLFDEGISLPLPFRDIQAATLAGWNGEASAAQWRKLVSDIRWKIDSRRNQPA